MTNEFKKALQQFISESSIAAIDEQIAKYPEDQRQSAVMSALMIVQEECNHLNTELMDAVADYLNTIARIGFQMFHNDGYQLFGWN